MEKHFDTYPGNYSIIEHDRVPAYRFTPGSNGYARFVTRERYLPELKVAGWMQIRPWAGAKSPTNSKFDGIHVHVGHIGNGRNYIASMLRRDNHSKISVEYGWRGYHDMAVSWGPNKHEAPDFVYNRAYMFEVTWKRNEISTYIANEAGHWTMKAQIPENRVLPMGSVGLRLDNLDVVGDFSVKEL